MRVAVIMGYILSAAFAYCGVVNLVVYILDKGSSGFLHFTAGFPLVAWPLAVALFLYLLIQMLQLQMTRMQERPPFAPSLVPGEPDYGAPAPYYPEGVAAYPQEGLSRQEVYFRMQAPPAFSEEEAPAPPTAEAEAADSLFPQDGDIPGEPASYEDEENSGLPGTPGQDAPEGEKRENLNFFRVE